MNHYLHNNRVIKFALALFLSFILYNARGYSQNLHQQALQLVNSNMQELGLSETDVENLYVADAHIDKISGVLIAHLQQQYKAINIHNALYSVAFKNGKIVSANSTFVQKVLSKAPKDVPVVSPVQAVTASAQHLKIKTAGTLEALRDQIPGKKLEFKRADISKKDIPVTLLWVPVGDSSLRLAWEVHIDPLTTADMWNVRIDALNGEVLSKDNWTKECRWDENTPAVSDHSTSKDMTMLSPLKKTRITGFNNYKDLNSIPLTQTSKYLVIPYPKESPLYTDRKQSFHENPWLLAGGNNQAVSYGWHFDGTNDYAYTRGNNVLAQEDRGNNNNLVSGYATPSVTSFPNLNFPYKVDLLNQPQTNSNTLAAITNVFYWCNIMHDISYQYGFDEAAGNFQKDNMGRGGLGNDFVLAEAQDGSGTNNANFGTPPDGSNPRMQMYLWNPITSFNVNTPSSIARSYTMTQINAGPNSLLTVTGSKTGNVVLYKDTGSTSLACVPATNSNELTGKIALIDRGTTCTYTTKIKNAQNAGAIAVIIINNGTAATGTIDSSIIIPSVLISAADGTLIKNQVISDSIVNVTISVIQTRDGDLDNGIIAHEYTHGISNRLTGGPKTGGCLSTVESGGMGEGWSDYFGLMVTTDWATIQLTDDTKRRPIGNFALGQPATGNGIRAYPYTTDITINPLTYANVAISGGAVHAIGTVWCTTLWDMTWAMIKSDGMINPNLYNASGDGGNSAALKLITLGMKLQPCNPGFLDARNAILKADSILFHGKYSCVIWNAFARRGMGINASQGFADSYTDQVVNYNVPDSAIIKTSVDRRAASNGEVFTYNLAVKCQCAPLTGLTIRDTLPANVTHYQGGLLNGNTVTFSPIDLQPQEVSSYNVSVKVNDTYSAPVNLLNDPVTTATINPLLWTGSVLSGPSQWTISNAKARGLYAYHAPDSTVPSNFALTSTNSYQISRLATLSFWHYYDTQPGFDGGVVELSTDSGATWIDAGSYMTDNSYTSTILRGSGTELGGRRAFSGFSGAPSFRQTIIDLTSFTGRSIKFRFRFITNAGIGGLGWFIDDILLRTEAGIINRAQLYKGDTLLSTSSDRTLIFNQPPLPLVSEFDVATENDQALVSWKATNDFDLQLYEVERSTDGINFEVIGRLPSSVSGNTKNDYHFIDTHPVDGTNFYRLKQVDFAGKIVYSDIKSIDFGGINLQMAIRPNPSTGWINITLPASQSTIPFRVYDIKGNLIRKNILKSGNQTINLSGFSKGVYILHFNLKDQVITRKLIIQ